MKFRLDRLEWGCVVFGLAASVAFFFHEHFYPSHYDAYSYRVIGDFIASQGLFQKWPYSELRSYGYPLILSLVRYVATVTSLDYGLVLFILQLAAYGGACLALRSALVPLSRTASRVAFCGLLLDYYVLIYPSISLTESLSLTAAIFVAACWLNAYRDGPAPRTIIVGSLVAGYAVMIRPANLYLLLAWTVGVAYILWRQRPGGLRTAAAILCVAIGVALPDLPQLANNIRHYGKATPLMVVDLGAMATYYGIRNIKYATAMPPIADPSVFYENPLAADTQIDRERPRQWYMSHPLRGAATLALHVFNMLDQDLLFTYSRDLDPWYRIPLGIVNHVVVGLGVIGLVLLGRRVFSSGGIAERDAFVMLVAAMVAHAGLHAFSMVEMRFGLGQLLLLFPLAGYAATRVAQSGNRRMVASTAAGVAVYVAAALALSTWVREQAPQIRGDPTKPQRMSDATMPRRDPHGRT